MRYGGLFSTNYVPKSPQIIDYNVNMFGRIRSNSRDFYTLHDSMEVILI